MCISCYFLFYTVSEIKIKYKDNIKEKACPQAFNTGVEKPCTMKLKIFKTTLPLGLAFCLVLFMFNLQQFSLLRGEGDFYGKVVEEKAYNFDLKDILGKTVRLNQFQGKYLMLTFGFTYCNGVCPRNLQHLQKLAKLLGDQSQLHYAFISIDPERDGPQEIQKFISSFDIPRIVGLTNGKDQTVHVAKEFKSFVETNPRGLANDPAYQIHHNGFLYLVNPESSLVLVYPYEDLDVVKVKRDIEMLQEKKRL